MEKMENDKIPDRSETGIERFINNDGRPDLFEEKNGEGFTFPCYACKHRNRPFFECEDCQHYSN